MDRRCLLGVLAFLVCLPGWGTEPTGPVRLCIAGVGTEGARPQPTRELTYETATVLAPGGDGNDGSSATHAARASGAYYVASGPEKVVVRNSLDNRVVHERPRIEHRPLEVPAALSPNGRFLYTTSHETQWVRLEDLETGEVHRDGFGGGAYGASLFFSPNGQYALFARHDEHPGGLVLLDLLAPSGSRHLVDRVNPSPTSRFLVSNRGDVVTLSAAMTQDLPVLRRFDGTAFGPPVAMSVSYPGPIPPGGPRDDGAATLDFQAGAAARRFARGTPTAFDRVERQIAASTYPLGSVSPNGGLYALLRKSLVDRQWHVTVDVIGTFSETRVARVSAVFTHLLRVAELSPSEGRLAIGTAETVLVFDLEHPDEPTHRLNLRPRTPLVSLAFADEDRIVTTDGFGEVVRWDLATATAP